jgi:hypothetical protein
MRKWLVRLSVVAVLLAALNYSPIAWGSIFGEENATLVQILAQSFKMTDELRDLNEAAEVSAEMATDLRDTYQKVNAGIDELRDYSFDRFLHDFKEDFYTTYPGFEQFQYASENLANWEGTRATSPWTAYEAITAVVGDLSAPLREDVEAGRANVDGEMLLLGEAGQTFAIANNAREATRTFDENVMRMTEDLCRSGSLDDCYASPGASQMVSARAMVVIAAQNSHIIRLLSRGVQTDGIERAIQYGERMSEKNAAYEDRYDAKAFVDQAAKPAPMLDWSELE